MAGPIEMLREIMTLTSTVGALRSDVDRLLDRLENHTERIIRLESREEVLMERMARQAAEGVQQMTLQLATRIANLEKRLE